MAEWVNLRQETTVLESGQRLSHHREDQCSGLCCLHGTSLFVSCEWPRSWYSDRQILLHHCPCGVGHPCFAGVIFAQTRGEGGKAIHGCCGAHPCGNVIEGEIVESTRLEFGSGH